MRPIEAMERALGAAVASSARLTPGAVIQRLSKETRDALEQFTSDDSRTMRPDWLMPIPKRTRK